MIITTTTIVIIIISGESVHSVCEVFGVIEGMANEQTSVNLNERKKMTMIQTFVYYGIHIFSSLKISNENILKNILEI